MLDHAHVKITLINTVVAASKQIEQAEVDAMPTGFAKLYLLKLIQLGRDYEKTRLPVSPNDGDDSFIGNG